MVVLQNWIEPTGKLLRLFRMLSESSACEPLVPLDAIPQSIAIRSLPEKFAGKNDRRSVAA